MLTALTASGSKMAIGDAAITAILGYIVVFVGLILLMAVTIVFGKIMVARKKKAAPAPAAETADPAQKRPVAPGSAGELKLYNVTDRDAALIMAIVADKMGKPLNELRFKSIKEIKDDEI